MKLFRLALAGRSDQRSEYACIDCLDATRDRYREDPGVKWIEERTPLAGERCPQCGQVLT